MLGGNNRRSGLEWTAHFDDFNGMTELQSLKMLSFLSHPECLNQLFKKDLMKILFLVFLKSS